MIPEFAPTHERGKFLRYTGQMRRIALAVLLAACSSPKSDAPVATTTTENRGGFTREQYIQLEIDTDCGWIKGSGEPKDREPARTAALGKLGKSRDEYNLSKGAFKDDAQVRAAIDAKVAECYRAAGFEEVEDPNGEKQWQKIGE